MIPENYFFLSFPDLLAIFVTIASVALIIRQLKEARLASQLEGFLELANQFSNIALPIEFVDSLSLSTEWQQLSGEEAYEFLIENEKNRVYFKKVGIFYEMTGALLKRGMLDYKIAMDTCGEIGASRWRTLEKAIYFHRKVQGEDSLYTQWEWLAENFSK